MPLDVSGVLIVLMMSGKKLSELRFVFILYSQDTFATTYGYVLCLPIGQANFALFQFQNGNKLKKKRPNSPAFAVSNGSFFLKK